MHKVMVRKMLKILVIVLKCDNVILENDILC